MKNFKNFTRIFKILNYLNFRSKYAYLNRLLNQFEH